MTAVKDIQDTARVVVGPEEPVEGRSQEEAEADHWAWMVDILHRQGVAVGVAALRQLPHDVVLSERLLARLERKADDG